MYDFSKERMAAISDGVIGVAATLLVIDLEIPDGITVTNDLIFHWSRTFAAWLISFVMVIVVWLDNHMFISKARHWSFKLTILTFLQLAVASLIPFASNLVIDHHESTGAMIAFNTVMMLNGLTSFAVSRTLSGTAGVDGELAEAASLRSRGTFQLAVYVCTLVASIAAGHLHYALTGVLLWVVTPALILFRYRKK